MANHSTLQTAALQYNAAGFAVLPLKKDKCPAIGSWTEYQSTKPNEAKIRTWFSGSNIQTEKIGIIAGKVSGNLEVIDIDCKYDLTNSLMEDFCSLVKEHLPEIFPRLVIASTINKGFHILTKIPPELVQGNKKLASRPATNQEATRGDKMKVLIETRGDGGYIAAFPSDGYEWTQGDADAIPQITTAERETLFTIARSFDQMPVKTTSSEQNQSTNGFKKQRGDVSSFDDYNERGDVSALLEKHGWKFVYQRGEQKFYKRPGITDSKISASFHAGLKIFYIFSTSTEFEAGRGFNPTQVYTTLEHGGDYSAASKQLYKDGYGIPRTQKTTEANRSEQSPQREWQEPKPLDLTLKPVETIDNDCLPQVLVDWLRPASKVIGCPFDFLILSAVVMIGTLIGSRLRVKPLQNSDWFIVPNLYAGLVGLPSTKKTPALVETRKPILELQFKAREDFKKLLKDYELDLKFYEKDSHKILKESATKEDYRRKIEDCPQPDKPIQRRFETNDITASKLIQFLSENPNGMMLFRDELTGWLKSLEADYDKSSRPFFLELWAGAINYELARVDGREIQLTSGTLSIIGGVQPSKLQRYVTEAYSFDNSDGFLQRFLFAYPDVWKRTGKPTKAEYGAMKKGYAKANEILKQIAEYDFNGKVIGANGDKYHIVKFDSQAQAVVDQWQDEIESEAESLQIEDEAFSSFLYKLPKSCFAIALIFHCLENISASSFPDEITIETALKAIAYTEVLISHARRVFALGENKIYSLAQVLIGKIKKGELAPGFKARDLMRKQWSGLRSKETVQDVLKLLSDYGYLREVETSGEGRPTTLYFIHPSLIKENEDENELEK